MQILHTIDMYINHYPSQIIAEAKCIVMVMWVVEFSMEGYKIKMIFGQKINIFKKKSCILWIDIVASRQKLGIILEKKASQNLKLSKNTFFKKSKKLKKDFILSIFDAENFTLKVRFWHFLTTRHYDNSQSFEDIYFWPNNFLSNFVSISWKLDNPYYHNA